MSDNTHGYVYDAENRIACVGVDINGNCTTTSTYYLYDAQGQRVGKQQADTLEDYVYDPQGQEKGVRAGERGGERGRKGGERGQVPFLGRPRFRIVFSSPNLATAFDTHFSEP